MTMEKILERTLKAENVVDAVDKLHVIKDLLENIHYLQQHIDEKYFGYVNIDDHSVRLGITHDYRRFQVFSRVLSDNVHHAEILLKDLLMTITQNIQSEELEQNV